MKSIVLGIFAIILLCGRAFNTCVAADYQDVKTTFDAGDYPACEQACRFEVDRRTWNPQWTRLLIRTLLETGQYEPALVVYETALTRFGDDLRLRLLGTEVYRMNNRDLDAKKQLQAITETIQRMPWRYNGSDDLVPLGQLMLRQGEDARQVLKLCFDKAIELDKTNVEALQATVELTLDKGDFELAATTVAKAIAINPTDPHLHFLSAQAWQSSDAEQANASIQQALQLNPQHMPSLLLAARHQIDAEDYVAADATLAEIEKVNLHAPMLWALRSVIAHFRGKYSEEGEHRREALKPWKLNPKVDHAIGEILSRHYRFEEAVTAQRRALDMDPSFEPAMFDLAQDLLRLGKLDEGWQLLEAVRTNDQYNVIAFNLAQLKARLAKFKNLEAPGLIVRMDAEEAEIYGPAVIRLLSQARTTLVEKYKVQLQEPVYVEIFPRQQDFAIRTFGLPGGAGYLGVCFGNLITANSPASAAQPQNWEATLWHEYCHVVTLQKSKNRMPRWLSEGISVYEERQQNSTWGQRIDRHYRQMLLESDVTPMSQLSSAFLNAKSGEQLQFAYFESSLAVEFLIEQFGFERLLKILDDLRDGLPINAALERLTGSLDILDQQFKEFLVAQAERYGKEGDWTPLVQDKPSEQSVPVKLPTQSLSIPQLEVFLELHPRNVFALRSLATQKLAARQYQPALELLAELQTVEPEDAGLDGVYAMQAAGYRGIQQQEQELTALKKLVSLAPSPVEALERLMQDARDNKDWSELRKWAEMYLASAPTRSLPHQSIVDACENLNKIEQATDSLRALLNLQPLDRSGLHFKLAQATQKSDQEFARRQVLMALENAPRYIDALKLLESLQPD